MNVYDFEYDNMRLSDFGFIVCSFGSKGLQTLSSGSNLTFNTLSTLSGEKFEFINAEYTECLTTTFQICKNLCEDQCMKISFEEIREILSWLNRKEYHKLQFIDYNDDYSDIFFEASFNVSLIEIDGKAYGLELTMNTNRPYALHNPINTTLNVVEANTEYNLFNPSDEEGGIYPKMIIEISESGDLNITNYTENITMLIRNCTAGEIITIDYPVIQTSLSSHKIQNDFNWNFFRLVKVYNNYMNRVTVSLPCNITMTYSPVVKMII